MQRSLDSQSPRRPLALVVITYLQRTALGNRRHDEGIVASGHATQRRAWRGAQLGSADAQRGSLENGGHHEGRGGGLLDKFLE